jgi:hypothetical protein
MAAFLLRARASCCDAGHIANADRELTCRPDLLRGEIAMSTTTQGFIGLHHRTSTLVIDRNLAAVILFCVLGLLASVYFMIHFPLSADDATSLASWL